MTSLNEIMCIFYFFLEIVWVERTFFECSVDYDIIISNCTTFSYIYDIICLYPHMCILCWKLLVNGVDMYIYKMHFAQRGTFKLWIIYDVWINLLSCTIILFFVWNNRFFYALLLDLQREILTSMRFITFRSNMRSCRFFNIHEFVKLSYLFPQIWSL